MSDSEKDNIKDFFEEKVQDLSETEPSATSIPNQLNSSDTESSTEEDMT